ncbi:PTS sugar transporter subunit IIA [Anaerosinus massiliensis]|uniref:PTS sugar transporter subunit IIA n=1 Tax=Massilibacillus massiliensis TaxID=1806837 RepID=UPI000AADFB84|nr:PTS sugar transporter subunit IIA [Massilibacillus massiliensis]
MDLDLIALDVEALNSESIIKELGQRMLAKNYVKDSYITAVLNRESKLPTGLDLGAFCVAIPHTDSEHVNKSNFAVGILKNPVAFHSMSDPTKELEIGLVFLLAVKDAKAQVGLLGSLMKVFQNVELMKQIKSAKSKDEIGELLNFIKVE